MNLSNEASIQALISSIGDGIVEKIDIIGTCSMKPGTHPHYDLTCKRTQTIYAKMTDFLPDEGQYEIQISRLIEKKSSSTDDIFDKVAVIMYILDADVEAPNTAIEEALFPEEFDIIPSVSVGSPIAKAEEINVEENNYSYIPGKLSAGTNFNLSNIFFHGNSALYKDGSKESLEELLHFMNNTNAKIMLEGHVNGNMGKRYLKKAAKSNPERTAYKNATDLSLARAESVKRYLVENGIDPSRIVCIGKGGKEKIYKKPKNQKENSANRRIEIFIL
ncbi:MAG: OmpA family protein [Flavobacteriales bacterium]